LKNIADQQEINEEWENIKTAMTGSAKETVQLQEMSPEDEWWNEECRQGIKQKSIARIKCLQQKTRANQEHYKEKREREREKANYYQIRPN
jgi:hypothetical protein